MISAEEDWKIVESYEIKSALGEIYDELVDALKLFPNNYSLFTAGLVYGLMNGKRHDNNPNKAYIKLFAINNEVNKYVINLVYYVLDDGNKEKIKIWDDMLHIADGGVKELNDIYKKNNNFRIPHLIQESKNLWKDKVKELHNINLKKPDNQN